MSRRAAVLGLTTLLVACSAPGRALDDGAIGPTHDSGSPGDAARDAGFLDAPAGFLDAPPDAPSGPFLDPIAALQALPGTCTEDHWCWKWPAPTGNDFGPIYAPSEDNIWLTAWDTVMQWDGFTWRVHQLPVVAGQPQAELPFSISGGGKNDVWVIYGTALDHWNGTTWTLEDQLPVTGNPNFNNVWVAPNGDMWATVSNGTLRHKRHGGALETVNTGCGCFLGAIWGDAPDDFFITTLGAGILHYDGTGFVPGAVGMPIAGSYQGTQFDVWVSGASGNVMRWDGASWTAYATGIPDDRWVMSLGATASDDVWWWFFGGGTVYPYGGFLHWDGTSLAIQAVPQGDDRSWTLQGNARLIGGKAWLFGGEGSLYIKPGADATLQRILPVPPSGEDAVWLSALTYTTWGTGDANLYVVQDGAVVHWDGTATTTSLVPTGPANPLITQLDGRRTGTVDELFALGTEQSVDHGKWIAVGWHYDGAAWTKTELDATVAATSADARLLDRLFVMGPDEAMAVGSHGLAYHYQGGTWTPVATGVTTELIGVWGPSADRVWMNDANGTLLRWDRANPTAVTVDTSLPAYPGDNYGAIHGANGTAWIGVTNNAFVWKQTAQGWIIEDAETVPDVLRARSEDVLVASDGQTAVARWNGSAFVPENDGSAIGAHPYGLIQLPGQPTRLLNLDRSLLVHP